jgi:hypothetical protein
VSRKLASAAAGSYHARLDSQAYGWAQPAVTARMVTAPPVSTVMTLASQ